MSEDFKRKYPIANPFKGIKSYSVDEIIAAGGTTAFANKIGKGDLQSLIDCLNSLPADAFLTEEEFRDVMEQMRQDKITEKIINESKNRKET